MNHIHFDALLPDGTIVPMTTLVAEGHVDKFGNVYKASIVLNAMREWCEHNVVKVPDLETEQKGGVGYEQH